MKKDNNKGFSLVELIVVICIMAVVVGAIAPQFIKYLEKSSVTADLQTLDAVYSGVVYASGDPNVVQDEESKVVIDAMIAPMKLEDIPVDTMFYEEVLNTLGWADLTKATQQRYFQSAHTADSEIWIQYKGSFNNPIAMWISYTDVEGKKDTSENPGTYDNIEKCIGIY